MAKSDKKLIYYIGKDMSFAKTLCDRFKKYSYISGLEFVSHIDFKASDYQKIFCELIENEVRIIYLDFTSNSDEFITLANLIKRDFHFLKTALVILIDDNELLPQTKLTTADFVHLKHGESYDVVYDPVAVAFPKLVKKLDFATAKFKQNARLREDVLISYITPTGCYIETNSLLSEGQTIELDHNLPKKVLKSSKCIVQKQIQKELIYDFLYGYELTFQVLDEPLFTLEEEESDDFEAMKVAKFNEYNELLIRQKKVLKDWVVDQASFSSNSFKIRIIIYDEFLSLFKHGEENSKKYPFSVRFQSCLEGTLSDIAKYRPEIISMQFDPLLVESEEEGGGSDRKQEVSGDEQTSLEKLTEILKFVKEAEGYKPYILIFNTENYDSDSLQKTFKYPFILVNRDTIQYSFLKNIAIMFRTKRESRLENAIKEKVKSLRKSDPKKYARLNDSDLRETKFFVDKRKELANASLWTPIKIIQMTESSCSFLSEKEHLLGSRCALDYPMKIQITLAPTDLRKPDGVGPSWTVYYGLLGCYHELQKQELRQFVNKIFFADLDAKKAADAQEHERIKEEAQQRRNLNEESTE